MTRTRTFLPLGLLVVILGLGALASIHELPGEKAVKDRLGFPHSEPCGPIINRGSPANSRREPPTPTLRDGPSGVVAGDSAYLVGGVAGLNYSGTKATSLSTVERFDFSSETYDRLPPLPEERNHVGLAAWRGDLFAVGGLRDDLEGGDAATDVWRLVPGGKRWTSLASMPTARGAAGAAVIGDRLYLVGGIGKGGRRLNTLEAYDLVEDRWIRLPSMRVVRDHLGVVAHGGRLYALGGRTIGSAFADFERYDPATNRWERLAPIPEPTAGFGMAAFGDRIVAAGGEDLERNVLTGSVWSYDMERDSWSQLASMSEPRHGFAGVNYEGRLWAFAGSRCSGFHPVRSVRSYLPRPG